MNVVKKRGVIGTISDSKESIKEKISALNKNLELCRKYKEETINHTKSLENDYKKRVLSYTEYEYSLNNYLKGQPLEHWTNYYEDQETRIKEKITRLKQQKPRIILEKQLTSPEKKPRKDYSVYMGILTLLLIVAMPLAYYAFSNNSWITGFMTGEQSLITAYSPETIPEMVLGDLQDFTITTSAPENTTLSIQWYVNNLPVAGQNSETFTYTPENPGEYEIKVLVNDLQGYSTHKWDLVIGEITENLTLEENLTTPEQNIENITQPAEENITLPVEENLTQPVEENLTIPIEENLTSPVEENLTQPTEEKPNETTEQLPAEINKPVRWVKTIRNENLEPNLTIEIPEQAVNIEVKKITIIADEELKQTIPFTEVRIGEETPNYAITGMAITSYVTNRQKIINFLKKFFGLTGLTITNPEPLKRGIFIDEPAEKYEISYETPPPLTEETETETGKLVRIYSDLPYENITTYASIRETSGEVKLYRIKNDTKILHEAELIDTNDNNLTDKVLWVTPHLSEQTFEIIINEIPEIVNETVETVNETWTNQTFEEVIYAELEDVDYFTKWPIPIEPTEESTPGYIELPEHFCAKTNSIKLQGADLGGELTFSLAKVQKENVSEAQLCAYAFFEDPNETNISNYIQMIEDEKRKKMPTVESIGQDVVTVTITPEDGWKCADVTNMVRNAMIYKNKQIHFRWLGEDLTKTGIESMVCYKSNRRDFEICNYNPSGMNNCDPYLSVKYE